MYSRGCWYVSFEHTVVTSNLLLTMQIEIVGLLQLNRMNHVTYHRLVLVRPSIATFKATRETASVETLAFCILALSVP
jgi:hypothetical protein